MFVLNTALPLLLLGSFPQAPAAKVAIGQPIPDIALTDMAGNRVRLRSFRGKKLLIFNWASW